MKTLFLIIPLILAYTQSFSQEKHVLEVTVPETECIITSSTTPDHAFIMPNPTSRYFQIPSMQSGTVVILDQTGKVVLNEHVIEPNQIIDTGSLKAGIYIIKILGSNSIQSSKIIIQ